MKSRVFGVESFPIVFGIIHALIDATAVTVLFSARIFHALSVRDGILLVLLYNIIAFAGQVPLGWLVDRARAWRQVALAGIAVAALSVVMLRVEAHAAMVLAAAGNAAFHVGAGALSLHVRPGRATPPGLFVAPGAIGLALGTMIGKSGSATMWPFIPLLGIAWIAARATECPEVRTDAPGTARGISMPAAALCLLLFSIAVRALLGKAGSVEIPKEPTVLFGVAAAAFAGKAAGGLISDRLGWIGVTIGALLLSAPLLAFGGSSPMMVTVGMFLFQMTMPVTLAATAALLPGRPSLAFGLTCLALVTGFLGYFFHVFDALYNWPFFLVVIFLSLAALYAGLRPLRGQIPMRFSDG